MPRITNELERKNAFSKRLTHKRKFVEKPEPSGMGAEQMRMCEKAISDAKRYVGNISCVLLDPSEEQAELIDSDLQEMRSQIDALRDKLP